VFYFFFPSVGRTRVEDGKREGEWKRRKKENDTGR